jgi:hypothetical protein
VGTHVAPHKIKSGGCHCHITFQCNCCTHTPSPPCQSHHHHHHQHRHHASTTPKYTEYIFAILFVFISGTMRFSRHGIGAFATHNHANRNTRGDPIHIGQIKASNDQLRARIFFLKFCIDALEPRSINSTDFMARFPQSHTVNVRASPRDCMTVSVCHPLTVAAHVFH